MAFVRGSLCAEFAGMRRDSSRRVLGVSRVEVCNGCPGPGEPGRTECAWVRRVWLSCEILLGYLVAWSMLNSGLKGLGWLRG